MLQLTTFINHDHENSASLSNCQLECILSISKNRIILSTIKIVYFITLSLTKLVKTKREMYAKL